MTKQDCDCFFCASTCPECGSRFIRVRYGVSFEYENDVENHISLTTEPGDIELECSNCNR